MNVFSIFKNSLQQVNWLAVLDNNNAKESYELFQSTFLSHFNEHFPLQTKKISCKNDRKPWITPAILISIRTKRRLERKARNRPDQFLTIYRRYRNLLTKLTRTTREQYYRNLLESSFGNSKKIWSNINLILGKKHRSQNTSIRLNGIIVSEPEPIASTFNSYFNDIPATLSNNTSNNAILFENYLNDQIPSQKILPKRQLLK